MDKNISLYEIPAVRVEYIVIKNTNDARKIILIKKN